MVRSVILIVAIFVTVYASEVEISASRFDADQKSGLSVFEGDVKVIMDKNRLNSDKLTVYTNEQNQPTKYEAVGRVTFVIVSEDKSDTYKGKAGKLIYDPKNQSYKLYDKVYLEQEGARRIIKGDIIELDGKNGSAKVVGKPKEPIRMIFDTKGSN